VNRQFVRRVALVPCVGLLAPPLAGCELLVQLDRSAVTVVDAGCAICSDASELAGDADDGAAPDDASSEPSAPDASTPDASTPDAAESGTTI